MQCSEYQERPLIEYQIIYETEIAPDFFSGLLSTVFIVSKNNPFNKDILVIKTKIKVVKCDIPLKIKPAWATFSSFF